MRAAHLLIGSSMVGAGALAGLWLPLALMGSLALLALLRICWIEDNIASDLFGRDTLPTGYLNTLLRRRAFLWRWFAIQPPATPEISAHLMATSLRAEGQLWAALLLGWLAAICLQHGIFGPWLDLSLGLALFLAALQRADRLALTLAHVEAGTPLPDRLLLPPLRRTQGKPR